MKKVLIVMLLLLVNNITYSQTLTARKMPGVFQYSRYMGNYSSFVSMLTDFGLDTAQSTFLGANMPCLILGAYPVYPEQYVIFIPIDGSYLGKDSIDFYNEYTTSIDRLDPYWVTNKPSYMSISVATDSITNMKTMINGKVSSSGSYSNPSFISSLAYSKLIGVPAASSAFVSAPFIEVTKTANQTLTNNTLTAVSWNSESTKTDITHDNTTNNSRITLSSSGNYEGGVSVWFTTWNSLTPSRLQIQVFKNGSFYKEIYDFSMLSSNDPDLSVSFTITNGSASDYYEIKILQNTGLSRDISTSSFYWVKKI